MDRNLSQSFLSYLSMAVALRKESVDRNRDISLNYKEVLVALRKESVDRNSSACQKNIGRLCRSPQGERG